MAVDETSSSDPQAPATTDASAEASTEPKLAAVDTGKRVDPSTLGRGGPRRRSGPEIVRKASDGKITVENSPTMPEAANGPAEAAPEGDGARTDRGPRRDDRGPRGDRGPRRDARGGPPRGPRGDREGPRGPTKPRLDFTDMAPITAPHSADEGNFAAMLAETGAIDRKDVRVGDRVQATCVHIGSETVFFSLSKTQEAHAPAAEFLDEDTGHLRIKPGDKIQAFVIGLAEGVMLSTKLGKDQIDTGMLEAARQAGIPVQGTVTAVNKGGVEVQLAGAARGFCPMAQLDVNFIEDAQTYIGKSLEFLVREVRENGKNIVLSRRALVEKERKEKAEKLLGTLEVGQVIEGTVTRLQPFGAFVDLGGLDGLIPIFELSFSHVKEPGDVVKVGDKVKVEVKRIEDDPKRAGQMRISLSLKSTLQDPFIEHADQLHRGVVLEGQVKKLESFGAFVELFPGVQGLVHVSQIADRRIVHPRDVLKVDEMVRVTVIDFDPGTRRVSLTMKENSDALLSEGEREDRREQHKNRVGRGAMVEGVVERIEKYGVFLKLDAVDGKELGSALLPASESGTPRGTDMNRAFPVGTRMSVLIIDVDERGRLKVSKTAHEQAEERALVEQYAPGSSKGPTSKQMGAKSSGGLGTFGDLLKAKLGK